MKKVEQEKKDKAKDKAKDQLLLIFSGYANICDIDYAQELFFLLSDNIFKYENTFLDLTRQEAGDLVAQLRNEAGCPVETADEYLDLETADTPAHTRQDVRAKLQAEGYLLLEQDSLLGGS